MKLMPKGARMKARRKTTPEPQECRLSQTPVGQFHRECCASSVVVTKWGDLDPLLVGIAALCTRLDLSTRQRNQGANVEAGEFRKLLQEAVDTLPGTCCDSDRIHEFAALLVRLICDSAADSDSEGSEFFSEDLGVREDTVWIEWNIKSRLDKQTDVGAHRIPRKRLDEWLRARRSGLELIVDERLSHLEVRPSFERAGRRRQLIRVIWPSLSSSHKRLLGLLLQSFRTLAPIQQETISEYVLGQDQKIPALLRRPAIYKVKSELNQTLFGFLGDVVEAEKGMQQYLVARVPRYVWIKPSQSESRLLRSARQR